MRVVCEEDFVIQRPHFLERHRCVGRDDARTLRSVCVVYVYLVSVRTNEDDECGILVGQAREICVTTVPVYLLHYTTQYYDVKMHTVNKKCVWVGVGV